jgi:hypothetical protein
MGKPDDTKPLLSSDGPSRLEPYTDEEPGPSGKPARAPRYTDYESSSSHLVDDELSRDDRELPEYSEFLDPNNQGEQPPPFTKYAPSKHLITNGKTISHDAHLNTDVEALYQWLVDETGIPPRPMLFIEGTHQVRNRNGSHNNNSSSNASSSTSSQTDFAIYFDLSSFIQEGTQLVAAPFDAKRRRGTVLTHAAEPGDIEAPKSVRDWCADYIHSSSYLKEFLFRKRVVGINEQVLRTHVEAIVRSTNYRGRLDIQFPVMNRSVVLAPDNWVCRIRYGWYRWIFYLTMLWIVIWPVLWFCTLKWEVVEATFEAKQGEERAWVDRWGWVLGKVVRQRRQGGVQSSLKPEHLRWIETHEMDQEQRRQEQRLARGQGSRWWGAGFLNALRDMGEGMGEAAWGMDEW